jgi:hypothetical protein
MINENHDHDHDHDVSVSFAQQYNKVICYLLLRISLSFSFEWPTKKYEVQQITLLGSRDYNLLQI